MVHGRAVGGEKDLDNREVGAKLVKDVRSQTA